MSQRRITLGTVAVLAWSLAGCSGGGASPTGNAAILGVDFAARAVAACDAAFTMKAAQGSFPVPDFNPTKPDPARLAEVGAFLEKTDATFTAWSESMKNLGQPTGGQQAWMGLLAAVDRHVALNRDQIDAASKGDTTRFAADYASGVETQAALLKAATDAGIPDCARVDR